MQTFHYKAMKPDGTTTSGDVEASDQTSAVTLVQNLGYIPIQVINKSLYAESGTNIAFFGNTRRAKHFHVIEFTRDLASLLHSGVSLEQAIAILVDLAETEISHALLTRLLDKIRSGRALSEALETEPAFFDHFYVNMVRAGEESGALGVVLNSLSEFLLQYDEIKRNVKTALIYPVILLAVTLISLMILMILVVPQFQVLFEDMGQELPVITQLVIFTADVVSNAWWIFLLLAACLTYWIRYRLSDPEFQLSWDSKLLRLPLVGDLLLKVQMALLARTLSTLLGSGISLLHALTIVVDTLANRWIAAKLEAVVAKVREGEYLADSMATVGGFPKLLQHLIRVGEETGELDKSLVQLADIYDREVGISIQRMLAMLEPALIIGLGLVIGGIIASILVAILSINELAL